MPPCPTRPVSRRQFLIGGSVATGAVLLGACSGDGSGGGDEPTGPSPASGLSLVQFFGGLPMLAAGAEVRAPFGLADAEGLLPVDRTPAELSVSILGPDGRTVVETIDVARHAEGLPNGYFPLRFTVDEPGIYTGRSEVDGEAVEMAIKVDTAADVTVIQIGATLPALVSPTLEAPQGVDPVCTNDPVCPLHEVTVADALGEGRPIALLVATPAFCQISICGPVLEVLLDVTADHPDVRFLHAEVYVDPLTDLDLKAPVVAELGLTFEPCLVLVGRDGTVADRLDTIYDTDELREALARLA
ncbi:MAG: hypothetical protein ABIP36_01150 [Acidimicrobiales bacterium]